MHDPFDSIIDSHLRDVPLPDGLTDRLRTIAEPTDHNLERWMKDVRCPPQMLVRCQSIAVDEPLHQEIVACDVSPAFLSRLRQIPSLQRQRSIVLASRAAVFVMLVGVCYSALLGWMFGSLPLRAGANSPSIQLHLTFLNGGFLEESEQGDAIGTFGADQELVTTDELTNIAFHPEPTSDSFFIAVEPRTGDSNWSMSDVRLADEAAKRRRGTSELVDAPEASQLLTHRHLLAANSLTRKGTASARYPATTLPTFGLIQPLDEPSAGSYGTSARRWERDLETRSETAGIEVPITTEITSFDVFEELLAEGRWPAGLEVRTEEFLAAMRYGFPTIPPGSIALFPAAAPAPFSQHGATLLQIGVKAGGVKRADARGVPSPANSQGGAEDDVFATHTTVTVRFNSQNVKAYRLLGHEPRPAEFELPFVVQSQPFRAGEEAVLLFEVWLKPGKSNVIADVTANWYDVQSSKSRKSTTSIQRSHIVSSFLSAPFSLQIAALAAEIAEVFRTQRHETHHGGGLRGVREGLRLVNHRLRSTPEFQRLVNLVEMAVSLRPELIAK